LAAKPPGRRGGGQGRKPAAAGARSARLDRPAAGPADATQAAYA